MSEYHGAASNVPATPEDVAQGATDDIQHGCFGVVQSAFGKLLRRAVLVGTLIACIFAL